MKPVELLGLQINKQNSSDHHLLKVKVLDANKGKAFVEAQGVLQEVSTDITLKPGQVFLVRQEQSEFKTVWRIVGNIEEGIQTLSYASLLEGLGYPESTENLIVLGMLRDLGLSLTRANFALFKNYLHILGSRDAVTKLLSMVFSLPDEQVRKYLLSSLEEYLKHRSSQTLLSVKDNHNLSFQAEAQEVAAGIKETNGRLRDLLLLLMRNLFLKAPLDEGGFSALSSHDQKLLGGQLFALARCGLNEEFFYFLPFSFLGTASSYQGEACLYPPAQGQEKQLWRLVLSLETRNLGWIQVDLVFLGELLEVGVIAEEEETKILIEKNLTSFKHSLSKAGLSLHLRGCKLGEARRMMLPNREEESFEQQDYLQIDLLI